MEKGGIGGGCAGGGGAPDGGTELRPHQGLQ